MRVIAVTVLATMALSASISPALAQDDGGALPPTVITNEEFCGLVSDDLVKCEGILTGMATARVVPEAFAGLADSTATSSADDAGPAAEPAADGKVGDALSRDDLTITLVKADWKPDLSGVFFKPAKGNKYVSVLVRYEALADGADYNIIFWDATDEAGERYEATVLGPITPDLKVGQLGEGETVEGWVTYEVPRDVDELRIIESQVLQPDLAWTIKR